jgi:hypothetical protein
MLILFSSACKDYRLSLDFTSKSMKLKNAMTASSSMANRYTAISGTFLRRIYVRRQSKKENRRERPHAA